MIWIGFGRKRSWHNRGNIQECQVGLGKTTKHLKQDSRCSGRGSKETIPEYKSGGLPPNETNLFGNILTLIREDRNAYKTLLATLGRQWRIEDNIKINLKETEGLYVECTE
jgi:hypothetical protein